MGTVLVHPTAGHGGPARPRLRLVGGASTEPRAVRVTLAVGSTLLRAAFRALLESEVDVAVAGEAGSLDELVDITRDARPHVAVMCLDSLGGDVAQAIRRISGDPGHPAVQVIVLSAGDEQALAALRAGASGALRLDTDAAELIRAVRVVAGGDAFLSPELTHSLLCELNAQPEPAGSSEPLDELTAREREVMTLAAKGLSNEEISGRLAVSPATAKTHVSRAMMKLRARDRSQLVALAYRTGLVRPRGRAVAPQPALALV